MKRLENAVILWARERGIIQNSTSIAQFEKLQEEVDELKGSLITNTTPIDDIGDCMVVLTIIANMNGLSLKECYKHAYRDIKDRKGYLNKDGIFVKETK